MFVTSLTNPNIMDAQSYFSTAGSPIRKKYDALKDFFLHALAAEQIAKKYGYTLSSFYSLSRDFTKHLKKGGGGDRKSVV